MKDFIQVNNLNKNKLSPDTTEASASNCELEDKNEGASQQSPWLAVARNGHKKSRITSIAAMNSAKSVDAQKRLLTRSQPTRTSNTQNKKGRENASDNRFFIWLSTDREWRNLSPAGLREAIFKRLAVYPASIRLIKPSRTGFYS
ncbi:putative eka-like protein [Golovinomyces cichoracearum]|uniref:Putative eka-like protein n=1 Tax=Golovinomyces cichoracearum TaxID=62708 RepID=A0A420IA31_9PEZI|nr:putative eka-like protein [Golovinomyces cichoracearum]